MKSTKRRKTDVRRRREEERRREAERRKRSEAARRGWITRRRREEQRRKRADHFDRREFASLYDAARKAGIPSRKVTQYIHMAISVLSGRKHLTQTARDRMKQKWDEVFENIPVGYWFVVWRSAYATYTRGNDV